MYGCCRVRPGLRPDGRIPHAVIGFSSCDRFFRKNLAMAGESKARYSVRFRTGDAYCVSRETAPSLHFRVPRGLPVVFASHTPNAYSGGSPLFSWCTPRVSSPGHPLRKPLERGRKVRQVTEANRGRRSWGCPFLLAIYRLRRIMRSAGIGPHESGIALASASRRTLCGGAIRRRRIVAVAGTSIISAHGRRSGAENA